MPDMRRTCNAMAGGCLSTLFVLLLAVPGNSTPKASDATVHIEHILNKSDSRVRPSVYGKPVNVQVDMFLQSFGPMNEVDMDFSVEIYFRQRWQDDRLKFASPEDQEPLSLPAPFVDKVWTPDLYFPNEKSGSFHQITVPNKVIEITPNGSVRYSARLTLKLSCNMFLMHFPLDYQDCFIKISSYSYKESQVSLSWLDDTPIEYREHELTLPQFEMVGENPIETETCEEHYKSGRFPCLVATFHLKRLVGFYVLQTYVPSILIVVLSWVSFWINKDAVPARISLGVTTVLTMTTQLSTSRSNTMRVSYPKAMDVWYSICMIYVFAALLEFAVVNVRSRHDETFQRRRKQRRHSLGSEDSDTALELQRMDEDPERGPDDPEYDEGTSGRRPSNSCGLLRSSRFNIKNRCPAECPRYFSWPSARGIDKSSRVIFPATFALFNFVYWVVYTQPVVWDYMFKSFNLTNTS